MTDDNKLHRKVKNINWFSNNPFNSEYQVNVKDRKYFFKHELKLFALLHLLFLLLFHNLVKMAAYILVN